MLEGQYLGHPPVDIGRSRSSAVLASMLRGGSSYAGAAGGGAPLAMPPLQPTLPRSPGRNPNADVAPAVFYPLSPALFKLDLRRRFGAR
ncbi:MAG: hypothetical protein ACRDZY_12265 [Acidimicrobiales bacterium]